MELRKLFQILVMGGAVIGAGAGCKDESRESKGENPPTSSDKDKTATDTAKASAKDGAQGEQPKPKAPEGSTTGGGVEGW